MPCPRWLLLLLLHVSRLILVAGTRVPITLSSHAATPSLRSPLPSSDVRGRFPPWRFPLPLSPQAALPWGTQQRMDMREPERGGAGIGRRRGSVVFVCSPKP